MTYRSRYLTLRSEGWKDRAVCAPDVSPDAAAFMFGPPRERQDERADREARAREIYCRVCPVARECGEYSLANHLDAGVWGGLGEADRNPHNRKKYRDSPVHPSIAQEQP